MKPGRRLWQCLAVVFVLSFGVLGWLGREIYLAAPPIPQRVIAEDGKALYDGTQIEEGQRAWRSAGGQQLGTVWGHGSYVAPDWSADWLHKEAVALRDILARQRFDRPFDWLSSSDGSAIDAAVKDELRRNRYDAATDTLTVSRARAQAIGEVERHYTALFGDDRALDALREQYAMRDNALPRAQDSKALAACFFWTS